MLGLNYFSFDSVIGEKNINERSVVLLLESLWSISLRDLVA